MKTVRKPANPMEWIAVKANLYPAPLEVIGRIITSRALLLASKLGVFEAAKDSPQTIAQIAQRTELHPHGLAGLMSMLTLHGYFQYRDGKFGLTRLSRKWCTRESPYSVNNQLRYLNEIFWNEMNYLEEFLRTGKGLEVHDGYYTEEQWEWYQLGQHDQAKLAARSAANMIPMPSNPAEMLDIGGSHGLYSVELCKKHATLRATVLDLAQAVEQARPIMEESNMRDRIRYWIGNALTDDFGENRYDLVLMSNLAHHFSSEQNTAASQKAAKALKTGGYYVIQDFVRQEPSSRMDEMGLALDTYFNMTSTAGTWSLEEMKDFQAKAGLTHYKVNKFIEMPSLVQVCARKE